MTTLTKEEKLKAIKRFLTEDQYKYAEDILNALDKNGDFFDLKWFTDVVSIPLSELDKDPCVSSIDALSDLLRKYREEGFCEVAAIVFNEIHLKGTFCENHYAFEKRLEHHVKSWARANAKTDAEIREEITQHEREIRKLRAQLTDIRD